MSSELNIEENAAGNQNENIVSMEEKEIPAANVKTPILQFFFSLSIKFFFLRLINI